MKVEYIVCDICKKKITGEQYQYSKLVSVPDPLAPLSRDFCYESKMDVCKSCMDRFKEWLSKAVEEEEDGQSAGCSVDQGG